MKKNIISISLIMGITILTLLIGCGEKADTNDTVSPSSALNYNVSEDKTLTVSGTGIIDKEQMISFLWENGYTKDGIKKVIIEDGITGIGKSAFVDYSMKSVKIADSVKIIDAEAFGACDNLQDVEMSDEVEEIRQDAFSCCPSLRKFVLPGQLKYFDKSALSACDLLIEIKNKSSYDWKFSKVAMMKGEWYCDGKRVNYIPAGKTIAIKPILYQIHYDLNGGYETEKLPVKYKHTQGCKLPATVRRQGYSFVQWIIDLDRTDTIFPGETGNKNAVAMWINFQLEKLQSGVVKAYWSIDANQIKEEEKTYFCMVRYSSNANMSDYDFITTTPDITEIEIKKMKKGKKYYVEYAVIEDMDDYDSVDDLPWQGKQSIFV